MEIVLNINFDEIVREEVRNILRESLVINNVDVSTEHITIQLTKGDADEIAKNMAVAAKDTAVKDPDPPNPDSKTAQIITWEYAPKTGRRRSKGEQALHVLELKYGRLLTPAEKGETTAHRELDAEAEAKANQDTKEKVRIDGIVADTKKALDAEDAEKANKADPTSSTSLFGKTDKKEEEKKAEDMKDESLETPAPAEGEATIPKTEELDVANLFK